MNQAPRIAVVGCGATGSVYAGLLAAAGYEVWAVDRRSDHIGAIAERGLRVSGASGDRTVRLRGAVATPAEAAAAAGGPADLVILATKAPQVAEAAALLSPLLGPATPILTIQNGLGSADRVAEAWGSERVLVGVIGGFGASIPEPGHAHHEGWEFVRIGEHAGDGVSGRCRQVGELWEKAGFRVLLFDDVGRLVWEKLICNVAFSGPCALTGFTIGEVIDQPDAWAVASACATEAWRVAHARGIDVDIADPAAYVADFGRRIPAARPSMLLDHLARTRSEIDVINGAIPREAAAVGLEAPVNATVAALVRARERDFPG